MDGDEVKTETKEDQLTIGEFQLKCEGLCGTKHDPANLFYCQHEDCKNDEEKLLCIECMEFLHRRKKHSFTKEKAKSLQQILQPDQTKYQVNLSICYTFIP